MNKMTLISRIHFINVTQYKKNIFFNFSSPIFTYTNSDFTSLPYVCHCRKNKKKKNSELMLYFDLLYLQIGV